MAGVFLYVDFNQPVVGLVESYVLSKVSGRGVNISSFSTNSMLLGVGVYGFD